MLKRFNLQGHAEESDSGDSIRMAGARSPHHSLVRQRNLQRMLRAVRQRTSALLASLVQKYREALITVSCPQRLLHHSTSV